ncbi:hypothetical protein BDU57DRAFT_524579 [Ampelomyces quisqualis]|uniref:Secreted protein n=1 Tax=Ampelomyces quisqualis TaxID=50730 RepID=A0A6A5Q7N5_AMPQU|nr:hypothetical protein BDU57DRAFT_524579 [Ampelomyces quisqualis]
MFSISGMFGILLCSAMRRCSHDLSAQPSRSFPCDSLRQVHESQRLSTPCSARELAPTATTNRDRNERMAMITSG